MPALNFQPQFAAYIEDGSKPHTIRALRRRPIIVGHDLRLYTGMRTKRCELLRDWTPCVGVQPIVITPVGCNGEIVLSGHPLSPDEARRLIWRDGFRRGDEPDTEKFYEWFCGKMRDTNFSGVLISWAHHELLEISNE